MSKLPEYDELDTPPVDPFAPSWMDRLIGGLFWILDAVQFWVSWPFYVIARRLHQLMDGLSWWVGSRSEKLRHVLLRVWWEVAEFLAIEDVRQRVQSIQEQASLSVDRLAYTVQQNTVGASWWRRMVDQALRRLSAGHLWWYEFLSRAEQSAAAKFFTIPARWLTYTGAAVADFMLGWLWTRNFRHLLLGIPAVVLLMPLAYCGIRMPFHTTDAKAKFYRRAADTAIAEEDFAAANLYFRKLTQLGDVHERVALRSAVLAAEQGDWESAYEQALALAPIPPPTEMPIVTHPVAADLNAGGRSEEDSEDESADDKQQPIGGMPEAHEWIAHAIAAGQIETTNPHRQQLRESHLRLALAGQPRNLVVRMCLAEICAGRPDGFEEARELLAPIRPDTLDWQTRTKLADIFQRVGMRDRAVRTARPVVLHFRSLHESGQEISAEQYMAWAAALELTDGIDQAVATLLEATTVFPDSQPLTRLAAQLILPYLDAQPPQNEGQWENAMRLLRYGLRADVDVAPLYQRLARLTAHPTVGREAWQILEMARSQQELPATALQVLGDLAVQRGNLEEAMQWYHATIEQDDTADVALNNLAYLMADTPDGDLDRALQLASRAVAIQPDNPHYLETRGQVFVKLERWQDAVHDLSRALNGMPDKIAIHRSLALAYRELGLTEQALQHARRSQVR